MGISTQRAVANMFGCEKMLDSVLSRSGKKYEVRLNGPKRRARRLCLGILGRLHRTDCGSGDGTKNLVMLSAGTATSLQDMYVLSAW